MADERPSWTLAVTYPVEVAWHSMPQPAHNARPSTITTTGDARRSARPAIQMAITPIMKVRRPKRMTARPVSGAHSVPTRYVKNSAPNTAAEKLYGGAPSWRFTQEKITQKISTTPKHTP